MSKLPVGARFNEDQPLLGDLERKIEQEIGRDPVFGELNVIGRLKWDNRFGQPDVADARRAFDPKVYIPWLLDYDGTAGPQEPKVVHVYPQTLTMSQMKEQGGEYIIELSCLLPDSRPDLPLEHRFLSFKYKAVIDLHSSIPWVDGNGEVTNQEWQIAGSPQFFKKKGRHELEVFEVLPKR